MLPARPACLPVMAALEASWGLTRKVDELIFQWPRARPFQGCVKSSLNIANKVRFTLPHKERFVVTCLSVWDDFCPHSLLAFTFHSA